MSTGVEESLEALERVAGAADRLGLDGGQARGVVADARTRLGFPGTVFVLALAGGTGSGKSSLLNALAGREVSRPGVTRPVTTEPVAWIPEAAEQELRPLLEWIGVSRVETHADPRFSELCIVDLPDYDSVEESHRALVDELLPRVDAVCWVLDPGKYNDRVLHEDYLRPLARHAERAIFVLNRQDTLGGPDQVALLVADVRRALAEDGIGDRPLFAISASPLPGYDTGQLDDLRRWLENAVDAKAIIAGRVVADCADAGAELRAAAGLDGDRKTALVPARAIEVARAKAVESVRTAVDVEGVRRACERRVRAEARAKGAGPLGRISTRLARGMLGPALGFRAESDRSLDPVEYARAWRSRSRLTGALNPVHDLVRSAALAAPPGLRPTVMRLAAPEVLNERLTDAVEQAVASGTASESRVPKSFLWPIIGVLQVLALAVLVFGLLWYGTLFLAGQARADLPHLPNLHGVPMPLLLVAASVLVSFLAARLLALSARRVGRRWADRLTGSLSGPIRSEVDKAVGEPLAELEAARSELAARLDELDRATTPHEGRLRRLAARARR